jgi:hypothetical protein
VGCAIAHGKCKGGVLAGGVSTRAVPRLPTSSSVRLGSEAPPSITVTPMVVDSAPVPTPSVTTTTRTLPVITLRPRQSILSRNAVVPPLSAVPSSSKTLRKASSFVPPKPSAVPMERTSSAPSSVPSLVVPDTVSVSSSSSHVPVASSSSVESVDPLWVVDSLEYAIQHDHKDEALLRIRFLRELLRARLGVQGA